MYYNNNNEFEKAVAFFAVAIAFLIIINIHH